MKKLVPLALLAGLFLTGQVRAEVVYSAPLQAKELGMGNLLSWKTTFEEDVEYYDVEKSDDGQRYENIGKVALSDEDNDEKTYRFFDARLGTNTAYYRLKVVEADGTSSYSQTVLVNKKKPNQFAVVAYSSVLTQQSFDLTLDAVTEGELAYALLSYKGELMMENFQYLTPGLNELRIEMTDVPAGTYKVRLKLDKEEEFLVIQREGTNDKTNVASSQKIKRN